MKDRDYTCRRFLAAIHLLNRKFTRFSVSDTLNYVSPNDEKKKKKEKYKSYDIYIFKRNNYSCFSYANQSSLFSESGDETPTESEPACLNSVVTRVLNVS